VGHPHRGLVTHQQRCFSHRSSLRPARRDSKRFFVTCGVVNACAVAWRAEEQGCVLETARERGVGILGPPSGPVRVVQEAEQRVEGGLMRRLVQRLHQRIDVLQTDGPPRCFPEPMPDLIKAMAQVTQGAFCRSTVRGVTEAPKICLKKSSHQSQSHLCKVAESMRQKVDAIPGVAPWCFDHPLMQVLGGRFRKLAGADVVSDRQTVDA